MGNKPKFLLKQTYLQMIKNSVGTKMFRNIFVSMGGREKDAAKNGKLSCAFYVSSLLAALILISQSHAEIKSTIKDMLENNWKEVKKPRPGDVLLWEKKKIGGSTNEHLGFYIGNKKAVSNNYKKRVPIIHHYTYGADNRKIIKIFRREM